jgi:DNA-binding NarL/FixJ family response regulator
VSIRVAIVDDHAIVRRGLEALLATVDDIEIVGSASDGAEAVTLVEATRPDVVLMDLSMPVLDGVEATRQICARVPGTRVVVLTSFGDQARILDALNAGADGYLLKHTDPDQLLAGIRAAAAGGSPLDPKAARALLDAQQRPAPAQLTDREKEVLGLVCHGLANKQIARSLGISERTVKAHLGNVFQRIGATDRTQAAMWAREHLPELTGH